MTALKTTPGANDSNAYVDEAYVSENIIGWGADAGGAWDDLGKGTAPFDEREALILQASRLIDQYPQAKDGGGGWGGRQNTDQRMAFPRAQADAVGVIPEGVKRAVIEYIVFRMMAITTEVVDLQEEGVTTVSTLGESGSMGENPTGLNGGCRRELDILLTGYNPVGMANRTPSGSPDGPDKFFFGGKTS